MSPADNKIADGADAALFDPAARFDSWTGASRHMRMLYRKSRAEDALDMMANFVCGKTQAPGAALNDLGVILCERSAAGEAINFFARAYSGPNPVPVAVAYGNLAYALYVEDRAGEAEKVCHAALRADSSETRPHYLLSTLESAAQDERTAPTAEIVKMGSAVRVFPALRWDNEPFVMHAATISRQREGGPIYVVDPVPLTRPGTHWGIMATRRDELWCAYARQIDDPDTPDRPVLDLPQQFYRVQRRRWMRLTSTGALDGIRVRSTPDGVEPFQVVKMFELDLSAGGVFVRTMPGLPGDTEVNVTLCIDDEKMELDARVIRTRESEADGVCSVLAFVNVAEASREKIIGFIHKLQLARLKAIRTR